MKIFSSFFTFFFLITNLLFAQDIFDAVDSKSNALPTATNPDLITEQIEKISASGKIFILSNNSRGFGPGDYISLVIDNQLVNRAIVAKIANASAGIKIIKVYSEKLSQVLRPGMQVQIIRGDDSYFNVRNAPKTEEEKVTESLIKDEDDLFNDTTLLEDNLDLDENKNRAIKTDNIVAAYVGLIQGQDTSGKTKRYSQLSLSWSYQLDDNIYSELGGGYSFINDYPVAGLDTTLTSLVARIKYTISAPFYSFIQPYIGYQLIIPNSPGAGSDGVTDTQKREELALVNELQKNKVIFGITALKRLVPGWFAKVDLGTDAIDIGFALEF